MDKTEISTILMKSRPFVYLNEEEIKFVQSFGQIIEYSDKEEILTQGKVGHGIYIILNGHANVKIRRLGEETITLAQLNSGDFFGEANLLHTIQCTATVSANQKTTCFLLPKICFDSFALGRPNIRYALCNALMEDVIHRYRILNKTLTSLLTEQHLNKSSTETPLAPIDDHQHHKKPKSGNTKICPAQIKTIHRIFDFLAEQANFHPFTKKELSQIIQHSDLITLDKKTYFIYENQHNTSCFLIIDGAVQVNIVANHHLSHFTVHPPHTLICPVSFIDQKNELFSYNTCGATTLLEIPGDFLISVAESDLRLWYKFYNLFCNYVFSLQRQLNTQVTRLTSETI